MKLNRIVRWSLLGLAAAAATVTGLSAPTIAQGSYSRDGLTIIGGVDAENRLSYRLDNNTRRSNDAEYTLQVDGDKIDSAVSSLVITIPEAFSRYRGRLELDKISVYHGRIDDPGNEIAVEEVLWDDRVFSGVRDFSDELDKLEIYLGEDVPANTPFIIQFEDVRNPTRALQQRVNLQVVPRGQELATYIGTWEMLIAYEDRD